MIMRCPKTKFERFFKTTVRCRETAFPRTPLASSLLLLSCLFTLLDQKEHDGPHNHVCNDGAPRFGEVFATPPPSSGAVVDDVVGNTSPIIRGRGQCHRRRPPQFMLLWKERTCCSTGQCVLPSSTVCTRTRPITRRNIFLNNGPILCRVTAFPHDLSPPRSASSRAFFSYKLQKNNASNVGSALPIFGKHFLVQICGINLVH